MAQQNLFLYQFAYTTNITVKIIIIHFRIITLHNITFSPQYKISYSHFTKACNKFSSWKYTKENKKDQHQHLKTNLNKNTFEKPLFLVTPWRLICFHTLGITIMSWLSESVCLMSVFDQHEVSISLQRLLQSSMTGPVWALMVPVVHDCDLTIIPIIILSC